MMAGDIDHRVRGPIGLIKIKCVLANLAIIRDETFVVATGVAAFLAIIGGEVGEGPYKFAPEPRALLDDVPISFVKEILEFFGMKFSLRRRRDVRLFVMLVNA